MLNIDDVVFFGRVLENFQDLGLKQCRAVFERTGIIVPVKSCSLLIAISEGAGVSASDLSRRLGYSHQRVLQKTPELVRLALISIHKDPGDERRKVLQLTKKGKAQVAKLEGVLPSIERAYTELFKEVGDIHRIVSDASTALEKRSLDERIQSI